MKRNKLTAENLKVLGSANSRFSTTVVAFNPAKDADKINQNAASIGIVLNEGDKFIINDLVMTTVKANTPGAKAINTLALAISRVVNDEASSEIELLPLSRFVNTLIDIPQSNFDASLERVNDGDEDAFKAFYEYAQSVRSDASKVFYKGEGAVAFGKKLMDLAGTADKANVLTVDKFHSHTATFTYSKEQAEARGTDTFTANQQYYILSV